MIKQTWKDHRGFIMNFIPAKATPALSNQLMKLIISQDISRGDIESQKRNEALLALREKEE